MRDAFISALEKIAAKDDRVMLITGDLGFGVLDSYRDRFPLQYINAGVAEQNMTLVAAGLGLEGYTVFTYSIGNFPTLRCLEMIRNDAAYHKVNVKVVAVGGGFSYGALGFSHHATEDIAIMRALPNVAVLSPTSKLEVKEATEAIYRRQGVFYLRLDKDFGADLIDIYGSPFAIGVPRLVKRGDDVLLIATGGIMSEVLTASSEIEEKCGISPSILSVHTVNPLCPIRLIEEIVKHRIVVTVEEHSLTGGLGSAILEKMNDAGVVQRQLIRIGLKGDYNTLVGTQKYLRKRHGIDAAAIAGAVLSVI